MVSQNLQGSNKARELAFRVLFSSEQGKHSINQAWQEAKLDLQHALDDALDPETEEGMLEQGPGHLDAAAVAFAHQLLLGFDEQRDDVDSKLEKVIEGWTFNQMSQTDLALLRLAAFEISALPTPSLVVVDVAVRLAKRYGGDDSGRFVNGVLSRYLERYAQPKAGERKRIKPKNS